MRDPEVQAIMSDPVMSSILQQAQQDPASLMQHMQNADVRRKVETLVKAVSRVCGGGDNTRKIYGR